MKPPAEKTPEQKQVCRLDSIPRENGDPYSGGHRFMYVIFSQESSSPMMKLTVQGLTCCQVVHEQEAVERHQHHQESHEVAGEKDQRNEEPVRHDPVKDAARSTCHSLR